MKTLVILLLFMAGFMVLTGVHEERLRAAEGRRRTVYRYVPRSAIDAQFHGEYASARFQGMFEGASPWVRAQSREEELGGPMPGFETTFPGAPDGLPAGYDSDLGSESGSDADSEAGSDAGGGADAFSAY